MDIKRQEDLLSHRGGGKFSSQSCTLCCVGWRGSQQLGNCPWL